MKLRNAVIAVVCISLLFGVLAYAQGNKAAPAKAKAVAMPKITVLSPLGTAPPVKVKPMAEPLSTLDGKTIYLVNTGFVNTDRLMAEFKTWLQANYPKTTFVDQRAGMSSLPAALKTELKEKADGVIFALGH
jgi:hypothetical protein